MLIGPGGRSLSESGCHVMLRDRSDWLNMSAGNPLELHSHPGHEGRALQAEGEGANSPWWWQDTIGGDQALEPGA